MKEVIEEGLGSGEDGAAGGVEVLVHRDINGVKVSGVFTRRNATIGSGKIEPGAVEVKPDLACAGPFRDAFHFGEVENFAILPPDRAFDLDGSDRHRYSPRCTAVGLALEVLYSEGSFASGERDEMKTAEGLTAIAAVVEE